MGILQTSLYRVKCTFLFRNYTIYITLNVKKSKKLSIIIKSETYIFVDKYVDLKKIKVKDENET